MQTVGVNAAKATDTTKFPRSTFGCVPRWQEERTEGRTERGGKRGHSPERAEKKKRDRCKINSSVEEGWSTKEGAWLGIGGGGANEHNGEMKVSLQHNKPEEDGELLQLSLFLQVNTN